MFKLLRGPTLWIGLLVCAASAVLAWAVRSAIVEPSAAALTCSGTTPPWWCAVRTGILAGQQHTLWGLAALIAGFAALFRGGHVVAMVSGALSMIAIVNHNVEMGSLALVFGLIEVVRAGRAQPPQGEGPQA